MTTRYVAMKVETCEMCNGEGIRMVASSSGMIHIRTRCPDCDGTGTLRTEIDADEWLKAALVRIGMYGDGK